MKKRPTGAADHHPEKFRGNRDIPALSSMERQSAVEQGREQRQNYPRGVVERHGNLVWHIFCTFAQIPRRVHTPEILTHFVRFYENECVELPIVLSYFVYQCICVKAVESGKLGASGTDIWAKNSGGRWTSVNGYR